MGNYYILKDNKEVEKVSLSTWIKEFYGKTNAVRQEDVYAKVNGVKKLFFVSTVFLGVGHYNGLFETMIFRKNKATMSAIDLYCMRYNTYEEALTGHSDTVINIEKYLEGYNGH